MDVLNEFEWLLTRFYVLFKPKNVKILTLKSFL